MKMLIVSEKTLKNKPKGWYVISPTMSKLPKILAGPFSAYNWVCMWRSSQKGDK